MRLNKRICESGICFQEVHAIIEKSINKLLLLILPNTNYQPEIPRPKIRVLKRSELRQRVHQAQNSENLSYL